MKKTTRLKQLIHAPQLLVIPGVPDPLCARIAERTGFQAVFLSGYASSAHYLGAPDVGLMTMTEMLDCARRIVDAVEIPVFADGDNGHGNVTNVARTMRDFEKAGVAAVFFEDQVAPKRCGHMTGKQVIPCDEMIAKIHSAADTRRDPDLQVMARTDARAIEGLDAAIDRMHRYLEAGADLAFIEAPQDAAEMRRITTEIAAPNMANMVPGGRTPQMTTAELQDLGFAIAAHPTALTYRIARAATQLLTALRDTGATPEDDTMTFDECNDLVGLPAIRAREARLCAPPAP